MYIKELDIDVKDFTEDDIVDMDIVRKNSMAESKKIFSKESTRRGRTLDVIYKANLQSQIAERRLIEEHGFVNDPRDFMDVIYKGNTIDVKTSVRSILATKNEIIDELSKRKTWRSKPNVADNIIGIDIDKNGVYKVKCYDPVPNPVKDVKPNQSAFTAVNTNKLKIKFNQPTFTVVNTNKLKVKYTPKRLYNGLLRKGMSRRQASDIMLNSYGIKVV